MLSETEIMKYYLFSVLFFVVLKCFSQTATMDSLKLAFKSAKHDTTRCEILNEMSDIEDDYNIAIEYNKRLLILSERGQKKYRPDQQEFFVFSKYHATALNNIGFTYHSNGDVEKALEYYIKSVEIQEQTRDKQGVAITLNNIGIIYNEQGNVLKALEYLNKALAIQERTNDKDGMGSTLTNIGTICMKQGDVPKALVYFNKSIKICKEQGKKTAVAAALDNIGIIYATLHDTIKSLQYFNQSLKIQQEIAYKPGIARTLNNIGDVYKQQGDLDKALEYFLKSLKINEEVKSKGGLASVLNSISDVCFRKKKYREAITYAEKSMAISETLGYLAKIQFAAKSLYQAHKAIGSNAEALKFHELYVLMSDSITNQETRKASIKSQFKYEYEKKAAADSVKIVEEKKVVAVQLKQEKTQRFALYGGLTLVLLFAGFMYNRFRITQKQKVIIEAKEKETQSQNIIITQQKHLVEEKHKEITDSINYAERIQRSFIATKELLDENLKDYFVMFRPKDVVSGDFYWGAKLDSNTFALTTADSTGHGVPGAIMSLLNITSLEKAIEHHIAPDEILKATRKTIIERLKKDGSEQGGKDGMDCSLICFDLKNNVLHIAAANNPVWIVRTVTSEENSTKELLEIKPDKMPVGKHDKDQQPFTKHTIELKQGDVVYALTDGFPDQFGGESGKKFMSKKLKELLVSNSHLPMNEQKQILETVFKNWVGDLEQVDDVTVIGVRV